MKPYVLFKGTARKAIDPASLNESDKRNDREKERKLYSACSSTIALLSGAGSGIFTTRQPFHQLILIMIEFIQSRRCRWSIVDDESGRFWRTREPGGENSWSS